MQILSLSLANIAAAGDAEAPALPVWVTDDPDTTDIGPSPVVDAVPSGSGPAAASAEAECGLEDSPSVHDWSDPARAVASVVQTAGAAADVWLIGTARIGTTVVHWRQGPFVTDGTVSEELDVVLPTELLEAREAVGGRRGTLSVRVVSRRVDAAGAPREDGWHTAVLPQLTWALDAGVGAPTFGRLSDHDFTRTVTVAGETLASADLEEAP